MDENASKGGSYTRQRDGSLKLNARTELTKPTEAPATADPTPKGSPGKKENVDG